MANEVSPKVFQLSSLEWFGLFSGVIGLIADIISLSSLFAFAQDVQKINAGVWILAFLLVLYTTVITGFYARRFFVARHRGKVKTLSKERINKIEKGALSVTFVVGMPLIVVFAVNAMLVIDNSFSERQRSPVSASIFAIIVGAIVGGLLCYAIHELTREIYTAFDPNYKRPEIIPKSS